MGTQGEQIVDVGMVWATQIPDGTRLLFRARRQFLLALTDRRILVFERGLWSRRPPEPSDLVLGKRYEFFTVERTRTRRLLLQVVVAGATGTRLVYEFRPTQRSLGRELLQRLGAGDAPPGAAAAVGAGTDPAGATPTESFWGQR